jgi:hypothetical protein
MKLSPWDPDIRSLVSRIDADDIDLQPDFQRQEVWSLAKKKKLIDTILREWSIPPVHFVVTSDNRLEVLDGQQRLATVRDFLHDQFSIDAKISPVDKSLVRLNGKFYSQLDSSTKRKVDNYTIRSFRISEYEPDEPNELFYRLNQPTSLTAGEQRNALFGPAREQLKELVSKFQDDNTKETIGFSNARMAYDDIVAKFLFFMERRDFGVRASESLISERFKIREPFSVELVSRAERSIALFTDSRKRAGPYRFNKASILSWFLFFSRFEHFDQIHFMEEFLSNKSQRAKTPIMSEIFSLFENRASLRVSDVSSVVYRDFCLWYAFKITGGKLPSSIPGDVIQEIDTVVRSGDDATLENILSDLLRAEVWGRTL